MGDPSRKALTLNKQEQEMPDASFLAAVELAVSLYEKANRHPATYTRQMISDHGEVGALSLLMNSPDLQKGFKVLRDTKQLDKTFEAVVVRFPHLFDPTVVEVAQWRMDNANNLL